jgi:hypothetical protein
MRWPVKYSRHGSSACSSCSGWTDMWAQTIAPVPTIASANHPVVVTPIHQIARLRIARQERNGNTIPARPSRRFTSTSVTSSRSFVPVSATSTVETFHRACSSHSGKRHPASATSARTRPRGRILRNYDLAAVSRKRRKRLDFRWHRDRAPRSLIAHARHSPPTLTSLSSAPGLGHARCTAPPKCSSSSREDQLEAEKRAHGALAGC